jgi:HEAT repeat protein
VCLGLLVTAGGVGAYLYPIMTGKGWESAPTTVLVWAFRDAQSLSDPITLELEARRPSTFPWWQKRRLAYSGVNVIRHCGDTGLVWETLEMIGTLGLDGSIAIDACRDCLGRDNDLLVSIAAETLGSIGAPAKDAVPDLLACIDAATDDYHRGRRIRALAGFGEAAADAVPPLTDRLTDANVASQRAAIQTLGHLGDAAIPTIPALLDALRGGSRECQVAAAEAVGRIDPHREDVMTALVESLGSGDFFICRAAGVSLAQASGGTEQALAAIRQSLSAPEPETRRHAAVAAAALGLDALPLTADLETLESDAQVTVRIVAAWARQRLEMLAEEAALADDE